MDQETLTCMSPMMLSSVYSRPRLSEPQHNPHIRSLEEGCRLKEA